MDTRRKFLKKTMMLSGAAGLSGSFPKSIQRALSIDPEEGSTFLDAEHVVILMQENRSFDHCFGALKGVRGFNDPRVITQPDGNRVWLQTNEKGETFVPFRFDIKDTKATWMGSIPHSRHSQVDANNRGRYDNWLKSKRSGHKKYKEMPLTLGHYNREDLPFNYTFADAFTVCDNNFCSVMSSTWPNRLFFFSGNVRDNMSGNGRAILNNTIPWGAAHWKTFAEHLEDSEISWKFYQNALSTGGGLKHGERAWLANFGLNTLEYFSQFNTRFYPRYFDSLKTRAEKLTKQISDLEKKVAAMAEDDKNYKKKTKEIAKKKEVLSDTKKEIEEWDPKNFNKLSQYQKNLYEKAFTTNKGNPDYMKLTELEYETNGEKRKLKTPKGDPFFQFRKDVDSGKLPTVSWLAPPQNFSDHPSAPWYGAWYTSEVLDILTKNPEVWKKTIFIMTYDENDGYFDHIPAYVAPAPHNPETGKTSPGLSNTGVEFAWRAEELKEGVSKSNARTGPIGLGFRVPMVIASPWSRGGKVCSELFDHTSTLQFLEHFLNKKFNTRIRQSSISNWRRAICGDLTTVFDRYDPKEGKKVSVLKMDEYIERIYNAKFKRAPNDFRPLKKNEIEEINKNPRLSSLMNHQEPGVRPARPLPYQLYVNGQLDKGMKNFKIEMKAGKDVFGEKTAGSPFKIYAPDKYKVVKDSYKNVDFKDLSTRNRKPGYYEKARNWDYAVAAGDTLFDNWSLKRFEKEKYHLRVYAPNGFYREFKGDKNDPKLKVEAGYERSRLLKRVLTGNMMLECTNEDSKKEMELTIKDLSYKNPSLKRVIPAGESLSIFLNLKKSSGWYDFGVTVKGKKNYSQRFAGHVETGKESISDPLMGGEVG